MESVPELYKEAVGVVVCKVLSAGNWVQNKWVLKDAFNETFQHV